MDTNFDFNKTGKFDFGKVGKRMPYSTPEGFFKEMEANILEQVKNDKPKPVRIQPKKRPMVKVVWAAALAVAASVAAVFVLNIDFSASSSQPSQVNNGIQEVDQAFAQLSSVDQAYLLSVYQEDVFLNN
ncbi:hypothetical protein RJT00_08310 [Segatella copri]|uniref:hypothetical protein n=1 Tax=Segatella copri TaxID=165179 RepID=UPI0025D570AA|nr:hypothetical protein [Segatella copri]MDV3106369.1 hypothetical protein [Segatella copri]MDV3113366.1 hypothetical protein [Segatella copri]